MDLVVSVEVAEDHAGQAAFEAAQSLGFGIAGSEPFAVVSLPRAVHADLGDRDAVQGGVELSVARASHADATGGVTRPDRDGRHPA